MKTCTGCKKEFPATTEYFQQQKQSKDGLSWRCKQCLKVYEKRRYWKHRDKRKNEVKEFYNDNKDKILEYQKNYYSENKEKVNDRNRIYRQNNREKINEHLRRHYVKNKEKYILKVKEYRHTPKGKQVEREHWQKRRKIQQANVFTLSLEDWNKALTYFGDACAYCGSEEKLEQEHVIPISKDGYYNKQNIIPACKACNSSKKDRYIEEWYHRQDFYNENRLKKIYEWTNFDYKTKQQQLALF